MYLRAKMRVCKFPHLYLFVARRENVLANVDFAHWIARVQLSARGIHAGLFVSGLSSATRYTLHFDVAAFSRPIVMRAMNNVFAIAWPGRSGIARSILGLPARRVAGVWHGAHARTRVHFIICRGSEDFCECICLPCRSRS